MSSVTLQVYPEYGFVILVFLVSVFMLQWLGFRVGIARKKYEIKYPKMYTEPYTHVFNCIQRAHQNTLEAYPLFLVLLIFGGILYPRIQGLLEAYFVYPGSGGHLVKVNYAIKLSAACGVLWIASRIVYAMGYYSGDPERRKYGAFGYIGLLILLINNVILALTLLGIVNA